MKILIACEFSGVVRRAFAARGHDVFSCDFLPADDNSEHHIQGDVLDIINGVWDMMIAHPPCTYLTCAAEWAYNEHQTKNIRPGTLTGKARQLARLDAVDFFMHLADADINKIVIENPIGVMSRYYVTPDQYIQPYEYGHDASKKTCLWLKGLPKLTPTNYILPRIVNGLNRWGNQTDSGQNNLPPSKSRGKLRSITYTGWAEAMAEQWGYL